MMMPPAPDSSALTPPLPAGPAGGAGGAGPGAPPHKPPHMLEGLDKLAVGVGGGRAPAFGGDEFLGKTPLMSPLGSDTATTASVEDSSTDTATSSDGEHSPGAAAGLATARREAEVDIETGGAHGAAAAAAAATAPASASARAAVADASVREAALATAVAAAAEEGTVLPCAPSDEEKVGCLMCCIAFCDRRTGRLCYTWNYCFAACRARAVDIHSALYAT